MTRWLPDLAAWSQIAPYLDCALDLQPAEREEWLAELTRMQPDTGARVRALLGEYEALNQSSFMEKPPLEGFGRVSLAGQTVGAYTIQCVLGRGGMGEVWLATRHDGRFEGRCAIKVLDDTRASAHFAERFRREGRLLARLVHPHIARLLDAGTTADGRPYLALEYVDGLGIDKYCETHASTVEARIRLFLDVVAAVAHAHANLIIHRDLKPSNVLVAHEGGVKLLDFGIAKLLAHELEDDEDAAETRVEEIVLTPEYSAPEQLAGGVPSTVTDVYQLGLLLYVLLTGRHPWPADISRADRLQTMLREELPRASDLTDRSLQKELRGDLDAILAMALRRRPDERYPTAAALGEDLRRYLNGEPVSARHGGALYYARKFIAGHKLAVLGTAFAVVSLCAAFAFAVEQAREAAHQRDQARLETKRADAQNRFMSLTMTQLGAADKPITPQQILDNSERLLQSHYGDDPRFVVDMLIELSDYYGNHERSYAVLVKAEGIARQRHDVLALARVQCAAVDTEIMLGHTDRAAARLAEGRAALVRAPDRTLGDEINCMHAEASLSDAQGQTMEAIRIIEQAVALLEAREPDHDAVYTSLLSHLSGLYSEVGDTRKGFATVHKHRLAEQHNYGTDTQGLLTAAHNEAFALMRFGEIQAAFAEETPVVERARKFDPPSGDWQSYSGVYGDLLVRLDRPQAALPWLDEASAAAARGGDAWMVASTHTRRARALHALHRDAETEAELDAADRDVERDPQAMRYVAASSAIGRAELLASRGNLNQARALLEPLLVQLRDRSNGLVRMLDDALLVASRIAAAQGRLTEAESFAREALQLDMAAARDPAQSADVGEATLMLAQIRSQLNDRAEAQTLASRAAISLANGLGANHSLTLAAQRLAREPNLTMAN